MQQNRKGIRLVRLGLAMMLVAMIVLAGCGKKDGAEAGKGEVVATYDGGQVTEGQLDTFINTATFFSSDFAAYKELQEFKVYMLKQMVMFEVLEGKATKEEKDAATTQSKGQVKEMQDYFKNQGQDLDTGLKTLQITLDDVSRYMYMNILASNKWNAEITDEDIKKAYDEKVKQDPAIYDEASVSHILIALKDPNDNTKDLRSKEEAKTRADEVKKKLDAGGDFAALAKEYSDDPGSKDTGGSYANERLATTAWVPEFKQAAMTQPVGTVGQPFETSFGYHIMKVDKRGPVPYENLKAEIKDGLVGVKSTTFIDKELPAVNFKSLLPEPSASPAASPADASASPEASPSPTTK